MTIDELAVAFAATDEEFLEFHRIDNPPSRRPDLCAFLLLDRLVPSKFDIVDSAEHDEIWLEVDPEALAEVATEADVRYLQRCGIRWDNSVERLAMFV